jgi:glycosyltransferase involved in cell wall biosynthesis
VLLEAAACARAVIAADAGGTREIFLPGSQAARLVPPGDDRSLASAIRELAQSEPLRRRLGEAARLRMAHAFDIHAAAAGLAEHYRAYI